LAAQVAFIQGNHGEIIDGLDEIIAENPAYLAAVVLRARAAELLDDIPAAFDLYSGVQLNHPPSALKVTALRDRALKRTGQVIQEALDSGHLDAAAEGLAKLSSWAPDEVPTLRLQQQVARALEDPVAELVALRALSKIDAQDMSVMRQRAVLETAVGDAGLGLRILQGLAHRYPDDLELVELLGKAKFRWRLMILPEEVRKLAHHEVLTRGDFAALLYWLFPEIRYGKPARARIANDVLGHAFQEEIVKVANLGLVEVDSSLHQFSPEDDLTRITVFRALLSLFESTLEPPVCLGNWRQSLSPSVDFVCEAAASCGLIPTPADCLPEATLSGQVMVEMGRIAQDQLAGR
jgi:hypothetical protein